MDSRSELDSSIICVIRFLVDISTVLQHHIVIGSADTLRIDHKAHFICVALKNQELQGKL